MPLYCSICNTIFRPEQPWIWPDVPEPPKTISLVGGGGTFECLGEGRHRRSVSVLYLLRYALRELNLEEPAAQPAQPAAEEAEPVPKRPRLMGSEGEQTPSAVDWGSLSTAAGARAEV